MKAIKIITNIIIATLITHSVGYFAYVKKLRLNLINTTARVQQLREQIGEFSKNQEFSDRLKIARQQYLPIFKKNLIDTQINYEKNALKFTARGTLPKINQELRNLSKLYHPKNVTIQVTNKKPFMELIFTTDHNLPPKIFLEIPEQILLFLPNYTCNQWYPDELIYAGFLMIYGKKHAIMIDPQGNDHLIKQSETLGADPTQVVSEITSGYVMTKDYICRRSQPCA